jgi:hypothetical protein
MKPSKRQVDVWKAREKLDEKLAGMTPDEITAFADGALERLRAKTGKPLKLRVVDATESRPAKAGR